MVSILFTKTVGGGEEQTICKSASRIPDCFGKCVEKYPRI